RMQRLHTPVEHFWEFGHLSDFLQRRDPRLVNDAESPAGRNDLDVQRRQALGELDDSILIGNAQQRTPDLGHWNFIFPCASQMSEDQSMRAWHRLKPVVLVLSLFASLSLKADDDLAQGKILVADRKLADPHFAHSVVYLITYDDEGAV